MKKILKWIGIVVLIIAIVGVSAFYYLKGQGSAKLDKTFAVELAELPLPTDSAALARGAHLVNVACKECHGDNLAGKAMIDDEEFGTVYAPNLTAGKGGCASYFSMADWDRAIRHGIAADGTSLLFMPSISFHHFTDDDFSSIVAYLKTLEPVDAEVPAKKFMPFMQFLLGVGAFDGEIQALNIDHSETSMPAVDMNNQMAHGDYLHKVAGCNHCHGKDMAGMKSGDPSWPAAPNITPGGVLANWSHDDFQTFMRTGKTPEGVAINPDFMPWRSFAKFTDKELADLYAFIMVQPALPDAVE